MLPETFRLAGTRSDLAFHHAVVVRAIIDGDKFLAATIAPLALNVSSPLHGQWLQNQTTPALTLTQAVSFPMCWRAPGAAMRAGRAEVAERAKCGFMLLGKDLVGGLS
jgi:hypothetical protein